MPSPFPGMDPWLESAREWPGFHDTLIIKTVEILQPQLRQRGYYAKPDARVWLGPVDREIGPDIVLARRSLHENAPVEQTATVLIADLPVRVARPEREFHEGFIEIYLAETHKLVTCIEFLSPTNKYEGDGRDLYQEKQQNLRAAGVHLVEIDLIRRGPHVLDVPLHVAEAMRPWEYLVNIVRRNAEDYEVYPLRLRDRLPRIVIPLNAADADAVLDLQDVFTKSYDIGPYPDLLRYNDPPPQPRLSASDAAWTNEILKQAGFRE